MNYLTVIASLLTYNSLALAAAQISCVSEDGSGLQAVIDDSSHVFQIKVKVRDGEFQSRPYAHASGLEIAPQPNGVDLVKSIIITENQKIIAAVAAGTYVDEIGGIYEVLSCEASF